LPFTWYRLSQGVSSMRSLSSWCILLAGSLSAQIGLAQTPPAPAPPPQPVPQVTPQLNTPGPQLNVPQPSNPAQQSSPTTTTPPAATAPSSDAAIRSHRQRSKRNREAEVTRTNGTSTNTSINERGSSCSFNRCVRRCIGTGQLFYIVGSKTGSSCQDQCKHRGCSERDTLRKYIDP
jgi:hypothetical protein